MIQMVQLSELNKSGLLVLEFFLGNPTSEFSYTEVRGRTKLAKATLSESLKFLVKSEFLEFKRIGVTKLYRVRKEDVVIKQFKILNTLLKLAPLKEISKIYGCEIFLYGSAARGEDTEKSDIDLLVIGRVEKEKLKDDIARNLRKLGKEIKIQFFSQIEWAGRERKDKSFYERVEKDKIRIG